MGKSKKEDSKVFRRLMCLDITEQKKKQVLVQKNQRIPNELSGSSCEQNSSSVTGDDEDYWRYLINRSSVRAGTRDLKTRN